MENGFGIQILIFIIMALLIGATTRYVQKGTRIPYTVALLIIGMALGLAERQHWVSAILPNFGESLTMISDIDPHILLFLFLPTLIFESAASLEVHLFRRIFSQIAVLAVPGLLVCTLATATVLHYALPWDWSWSLALLFGALISATDPVAVVALLKEVSSRKRLETLIEGESLLNDGTAIVLFTLFLALASGSAETNAGIVIIDFIWVVCLGLIVGAAVGGVILGWIGRVFNDPLIEITLTVASAYLVFYLAEGVFHVSGVVAVVALALLFAGWGRTLISPEVAGFLHQFWDMLAHFANTLIFLIVGIVVVYRVPLDDPVAWMALLGLYVAITVIRGATIMLFMPILKRIGVGITREKAIVLWWGGLRGAVSLALALTVVQLKLFEPALSDQVLFLCAGIVVLTIVINGSTMGWLLGRLGLDKLPAGKQATVDKAKGFISEEMQKVLPDLKNNRFLAGADWERINELITFAPMPPEDADQSLDQDISVAFRRRLLETERQYYWTLFRSGTLGRRATQHLVDAVEHALDGTPILFPRAPLQQLWKTPPMLSKLRTLPGCAKFAARLAFRRMALGYDIARGFVLAQDEMLSHVHALAPNDEIIRIVEQEIYANKKDTFGHIEQLRQSFPEVIRSLETSCTMRILLNRERNLVRTMHENAILAKPEAEKLLQQVEQRMQLLARTPVRVTPPDPYVLLQETDWSQDIQMPALEHLVSIAEHRVFGPEDRLFQEGQEADGLFLVVRGQVELYKKKADYPELVGAEGPGAMLGVESLLTGIYTLTIRTISPVDALWIPLDRLKKMLADEPELLARLMRLLNDSWQNDQGTFVSHPAEHLDP